MRVALFTPHPDAPWLAALRAARGSLELAIVSSEPPEPPSVELDLYHVADDPAHGFVYRALLRRPGIVLLAEWGLHALVHAETAGRADPLGYRREARRAHGDTGAFVARQVLAGRAGALARLLSMNQRVLDHSLAVVVFSEQARRRAAQTLPDRPVVRLALDGSGALAAHPDRGSDATTTAAGLWQLVRELAPRAEARRRALLEQAAAEQAGSSLGAALAELRWSARELSLPGPPGDAVPLVASLFEGDR